MCWNAVLPPPVWEWEARPLLERPEHTCVETGGLGPGAWGPLVPMTVCCRGAGQEEGWPGAECDGTASSGPPRGAAPWSLLSKERAPQGRVNILSVKQPSASCFWGGEERASAACERSAPLPQEAAWGVVGGAGCNRIHGNTPARS